MRKILSFLVIFLFLLLTLIVVLEILYKTKINECPLTIPSGEICIFSSSRLANYNFLEKKSELENLKRKRLNGEKFSKEDYRRMIKEFVFEVEPQLLEPRNGISCGSIAYVRNDLPGEAKKFVKRHELEHLLQTGGEKNREFSANLAAGKEYPLGLLQTILFSLRERAKYYDSFLCYILTLWKTFKIYFLPW